MRSTLQLVLPFVLVFCAQAASIEGNVTFTLTSPGSRAAFAKAFGDDIKATCEWRVVKVLGEEKLFAGISVKNTASKKMWFVYSVAFFDKDGKLVGTASRPLLLPDGLPPGTTQSQPCIVYLPPGKYKDIASYQAIIYEQDYALVRGKGSPVQLEDPGTIAPEIRTNRNP
ncbi:MAG: hypothetical protein NT154_23395 [Verrucomicrobia bacterium]|nr:hypothetical protein [Verrucomicrobiota bacterium]